MNVVGRSWDYRQLTGGTFGTSDDTSQFQNAPSLFLPQDISNIYLPDLGAGIGQFVAIDVFYRTWTVISITIGEASVGAPVWVWLGGDVTSFNAAGTYQFNAPPGSYQIRIMRSTGALKVTSLGDDVPKASGGGVIIGGKVAAGTFGVS